MSKGSSPRPFSVSQLEYDTRWDTIFGRDLKEDKPATSGLICPKCGVDRTKEKCPNPGDLFNCGIKGTAL